MLTVVNPAPVGVNDNLAVDVAAATGRALLPGQGRMGLRGVVADLLGNGHRDERESGKREHRDGFFGLGIS